MQDTRYDWSLTIEQLKQIEQEYDGTIFVIINGEYYELKGVED